MLLKEVVKEEIAKGKIVLFSSHQMHYIEEFCDSIAILKDGKVALHGELGEIKHSYPRNKLVVRSAATDEILALPGLEGRKTGEGELLLSLSSAEAKGETMKMLAERFDIDEMRVFEPSLGDIFVEYAGD